MKSLQAIFFDIDDTLCATSEFTQRARMDAIQAMIDIGLKLPKEYLWNELMEVIQEFTTNYSQHFDKLLLRIPPESYQHINKAILVAVAVVAYHDAKKNYLKVYSDCIRLLDFLKPLPILKGIITEGFAVKQAEKLVRLNLYSYLDDQAIFITDQIGISKTNPKIFQLICQRCNILPENTLYVGDNPYKDIDSANASGIITVRVRRGKYKEVDGKTNAVYDIQNLDELQTIVQKLIRKE